MGAAPSRTIDGYTRAEAVRRARILRLLNGGGESLSDFIGRLEPRHAPIPRHLEPLVHLIERARHERIRACISMPPRHGKAVAVYTPMLTARGWTTAGEVQVGDLLVGSDGEWTRVEGVYPQGEVDLFDVTFSDGATVRTCAEHVWSVRQRYGARWRKRTTRELSEDLQEADGRKKWRIPMVRPFRGHQRDLLIDPYLLGAWLGDGHSRGAFITTADADVVRAFEDGGREVRPAKQQNSGAATTYYVFGLHRNLRLLGVLRNKHIPAAYMEAPVAARLALLQGLCDTDGTVAKDGSLQSFTTTNPTLARDVRRLICGLGGKVTTYTRPAGRKTAVTYQFRLPHGMAAFRLPRKRDRLAPDSAVNEPRRFVASVRPAGRGHAVCFEVAAQDHLFCAGDDFVVTHNTETIKAGLAWWLKATPRDTCAYVSYSSTQAESKSVGIRAMAERAGVTLGFPDRADEWRTTTGGGLLATGAGGGLTGQGVQGLIIVDDPYKNREEAESPAIREKIWDWFSDVVYTRMEDASVIVVHTRWVNDDLIGRLTDEHGWEYINLPAIAEVDDPLGRDIGEALWPSRFPRDELDKIKALNEFGFASLYQGAPRPRGACVFGQETYYDQGIDLSGCRLFLTGDPAATDDDTGDHGALVALAVTGYKEAAIGHVLDVWCKQVTVPAYVRAAQSFIAKHGGIDIGIEAVAGFKGVPQTLQEIDRQLRVRSLYPVGDKFLRSQPAGSAWNQGRIRVPRPTPERPVPWLKEFLHEVKKFTGVKDHRDDQVDALVHAWNEAMEQGSPVAIPRGLLQRRI